MSLLNLPPLELAKLWGELVECYYGISGGNTVIYAYRFNMYNPSLHKYYDDGVHFKSDEAMIRFELKRSKEARIAGNMLIELCNIFETEYNCKIEINDGKSKPFHNCHSCYIAVLPPNKS